MANLVIQALGQPRSQEGQESSESQTQSGYEILDLDAKFFCSSATASEEEKKEAFDTLVKCFCGTLDDGDNEEDDEAEPTKLINDGKDLSVPFKAGILLLDLIGYSWQNVGFDTDTLTEATEQIFECEFEDYGLRNLQARILAYALQIQLFSPLEDNQEQEKTEEELFNDKLEELFEPVIEKISESSFEAVDMGLRLTKAFLDIVEESEGGKNCRKIYNIVPVLLPHLFSAFTNEEIGIHGREQILHLFYLLIRIIAWADGIDNELVSKCLGDTFQSWMALFLQVIQSNPRAKQYFNVKKNALKCLTVIFRDLINYSRDSINLILKPAWKLLNQHLPVFTEVVAYNQPIPKQKGQTDEDNDDAGSDDEVYETGYESFDVEEIYGVEGMTFHLLELLGTLVQRPNVQSVIIQGLMPLTTTISSYLLVQHDSEREHKYDPTFFISEKSQEMLRAENIRSQCLVLLSSIIEVFGDAAVQCILFVIQNIFVTTGQDYQRQNAVNQGIIAGEKNEIKEESEEADEQEEKKESDDPEESKEADEVDEDEQEFKQMLEELIYISKHPKNIWKRRDVSLLLLGIFIEDISMYMIRHPHYDMLQNMFDEVLKTKYEWAPKSMRSGLVGRSIWTCQSVADLVPRGEAGDQFMRNVIEFSVETLKGENEAAVKLIATRCLIKYCRKLKAEELQTFSEKFETILDPLLLLLETTTLEYVYLPIEAFQTFSRINEATVAQMTPKVLPKLLKLFRIYHSEGSLGTELISLFKLWCNYDQCKDIFVETFIPFIMEIVGLYYQATPNKENQNQVLSLKSQLEQLEKGEQVQESNQVISVVDSSILQHVLDLLCSLLKNARTDEEKEKVVAVFPKLLSYVERSEDMFLLLNGTTTLKTFIHLAHTHVLKLVEPEAIIEVCKKLLSPQTNEQAALCLGNLVIQVIHKIQPKIDTQLLMSVVQKIYKSRMPSIVQSLVLIFARLIQTNPTEIVGFLSETSIDNRISLKIVLDKWLLQQALFRGTYTRTVTMSSILKLFQARDPRVETLMVIGYNPSHSNINSEVNAPFKMLSLMLRFLENELKPTKLRPMRAPADIEEEEGGGAFGGYSMRRDLLNDYGDEELAIDSGNRMDTIGGGDDDDEWNPAYGGNIADDDKLDVNLDDIEDEDDDDDVIDLSAPTDSKQEQINTLKEQQSDDSTKANTSSGAAGSTQSSGSSGSSEDKNMFKVGESNDKGLADMETGSEVYMSELLAGFDMDDFDEAEEMNEEDLAELGDEFAKIDLVKHIQQSMNDFIEKEDQGWQYVYYCAKKLNEDDLLLAKKYLKFPASAPPL